MASEGISSPGAAQEPTIGICDQSKDCLAPTAGHLKKCPLYVAPASASPTASTASITNSESVDLEAVGQSIERLARAAGIAAAEREQARVAQEAEDERARVIASWANPLAMVMSEFPEQATGASWWPWRVFLKVVHAITLDPEELAFAQKCTGRTIMPTKPVRRVFCGPGRRGGKSFTAAIQAIYTAVRPRSWTLAPGETSTVPIVAADRRQARVIFNYVKGLLEASPRLAPMIVSSTKDTITLDNQTRIEIHTASFKTSRGYTLAGFFGDEVAFWESAETSTNPDKEIIGAVKPGLLTSRGPLVITSTPYSRRGVLWEGFKDNWGKDEATGLYWKASSLDMNPNLDPEEIARAYEEDPEAASAEYGGEFRSDLAAFISEELLASVTIPGRGDLPYAGARYKYVAFVDPSGGSIGGDSFTLAIGHSEGTRHIVDCIREVTPPFSTDGTVREFCETLALYKIREVHGDKYAGEWPTQSFRDSGGVTYHQSEDPKSELYLQTLPLITSGVVELPEHKRLLAQFRALERRTARSGKDSIDHPPRGKDDVSNAVAGLLALLARKRRAWGSLPAWHHTTTTSEKAKAYSQGAAGVRPHDGFVPGSGGKFISRQGEAYFDPRFS